MEGRRRWGWKKKWKRKKTKEVGRSPKNVNMKENLFISSAAFLVQIFFHSGKNFPQKPTQMKSEH